MGNVTVLDGSIIIIYFLILIGIGLYLKKKASASMDDYFLGGRNIPWWALGIASMTAWLDMTGTMIIVSFLYLLGPRGLYIEFRGGAGLILIFLMIWVGKWHRRSGKMTNAEWMIYRFGNDFWGKFARVSQVISMFVLNGGILAYTLKGSGLFLSMFLPFSPVTCALIMLLITLLYTLMSGFYGVIVTDIFQAFCIWAGVILIIIIAVNKTIGVDLAVLTQSVTGNPDWTSTIPQWHTSMPAGYENYSMLTMMTMFYLLKTVIQGLGFPVDSKFFAARNDREVGLLSFVSGWTLMLRWPLMIGFAILGVFLIKDLFPDQSVLAQAANIIKETVGDVSKAQWPQVISGIQNNSSEYSAELIANLKSLLGEDWVSKLSLLSYQGTVDPERILPAVLLFSIPNGMRGLLLVALLAAAMSTFSVFTNWTTALWTRDIYQAYLHPQAKTRELIFSSYGFSIFLVASAFFMAYSTESINDIWGWITMGIVSGMAVPIVLRFYWWRFNGCGFAIGTLIGTFAAILQRIFIPHMQEWQQFIYILFLGMVGSVIGTYANGPTTKDVLENFYKTTRPFGLWGRLKTTLHPDVCRMMQREHRNDIIACPFALGWLVTILLLPMQLMVKAYLSFWITFFIFVISFIGLYYFWYRNLPSADDKK